MKDTVMLVSVHAKRVLKEPIVKRKILLVNQLHAKMTENVN